jgi:hypothetical protein
MRGGEFSVSVEALDLFVDWLAADPSAAGTGGGRAGLLAGGVYPLPDEGVALVPPP